MENTTQNTSTAAAIVCDGTEPGFELETSPGVTVQPLLATRSPASDVDVFFLTLKPGAEVTPESHPYSETLVVLEGELRCQSSSDQPVTVRGGQIWHNPPGAWHHVKNHTGRVARAAMYLGL